jgi:lysophospholipase L1-like esterase
MTTTVRHIVAVALPVLLTGVLPASVARADDAFEMLKDSQTIVFLGDSITYGGEYVVYFERWLTVNHPELAPRILNLGLPSETVSGLSEPGHMRHGFPRPDLHERLERTLGALKPDLIIACYGMNCGIYMPFDEQRFSRYREGIIRLKKAAENHQAAIVFMTPPVYDNHNPKIKYDDVLAAYAKWLVSKRSDGWHVIDLHTAMKKELEHLRKKDPGFKFARDGVHPGDKGHQLMAQQLIDFFAVKPPLANPDPNSYGRMMMFVRERMRVLRDAWLTEIGHKRPMKAGKPLDEAKRIAEANTKRIQETLAAILKHAKRETVNK